MSRYLKSLTNDRLYIWTPILAERNDLYECDGDGELLENDLSLLLAIKTVNEELGVFNAG